MVIDRQRLSIPIAPRQVFAAASDALFSPRAYRFKAAPAPNAHLRDRDRTGHVAYHIVGAEPVGGERADRSRLHVVPAAAADIAIGIVSAARIAPALRRLATAASRVFVFV